MADVADGNVLFDNDIDVIHSVMSHTAVVTGLIVSEHAPQNMSVDVAAGTGDIAGVGFIKAGVTNIAISAAHATLPRKTIITINVSGAITATDGTPAAAQSTGQVGANTYEPVPPDIPANQLLLAEIWIPANATAIVNSYITSKIVTRGTITKEIFVRASNAFDQNTSTFGTYSYFVTLYGGANADDPMLLFPGILVPLDFLSFTSLKLVWASPAVAGNQYWAMNASWGAVGEVVNVSTEASTLGVTATAGADLINVQTSATPLVLSGLAAGDYLGVQCSRNGAHANDTLNQICHYLGVLFTYVAKG